MTCPLSCQEIASLEALMDEEIALLDLRRSQLSCLCGAIVDRDEDAVEGLLEQIERAQQLQAATDGKLQALRKVAARRLCRPEGQVKLSGLIAALDEPLRPPLAERRQRIIDLAGRLQQEHMRTVILLTECARLNRMLLEGLFPQGEGVTTYDADGAEAWRGEAGLVDTER